MFTLVELTSDDWNYVGLSLNILADCIFFASLYWGHWRINQGEVLKVRPVFVEKAGKKDLSAYQGESNGLD